MFPQALFMSFVSFKFSEATNLFEILSCYCPWFHLIWLIETESLCVKLPCCLFTYQQTRHQDIWMLSRIYQDVINRTVILSIRTGLSVFKYVLIQEHCALNWFLMLQSWLILLSLLFSCEISWPAVGVKTSPVPNFALKLPNRTFIGYLGNWLIICSNFSQKLSFCVITVIPKLGTDIRNSITPASCQN
jgi:hypothetical protein